MEAHKARDRTCPLLPLRPTGAVGRHEPSPCNAPKCLWWQGDSKEGYCIITVLEPLTAALERIAE